MNSSNYSNFRMINWDWIQQYQSIMGKGQYKDFFDKVYARLLLVPEGKYLDIDRYVTEKSRDIFIKISCLFILEQRQAVGDYWCFNEKYNCFIHKRHE